MKNIHIKSVMISALVVYVLGVTAFVASYFFPVMHDPDLQANWVLSIALIPSVALGTHIYYRKGHKTHGFILGVFMFLIAMLLDAIITVPLLIMPHGGNHISFFTDPGFWLIAVEYISIVLAYWQIESAIKKTQKK